MNAAPKTVRLADYRPPDYLVDRVDLTVLLYDGHTDVRSRLTCRRSAQARADAPLLLDGEALTLRAVALDDRPLGLDEYEIDEAHLTLHTVPEQFELFVETRIHPEDNTRLEGLYRSGGMYCTQCEAEGFRRITFYPDRPDVMARYTVTIEADRGTCPILLSNGNPVAGGELEGDRHWARWEDPFPKPSYLFALVAGDLHCHEGHYRTGSGRDIRLAIYTEHANAGKTAHAMASLQAAMHWDEETYGLECDLDNYLIVAVGDFNMGAMENKGLNIFNTQYVLARPETATDADYAGIEAVIGHEYFHNWTGNRVTLRDWFQLSLKEGLTVFREQQFTAAMGAPAVRRIDEVRTLRAAQFPEDAGPLAHPVRPAEFVEINNFYTATVYMKGAEVIGMYRTLLGDAGFRRGIELYFRRHDGEAVTCEDFLAAMADANAADLAQFARWYHQSGTPVITVTDDWDADTGRYRLHLRQQTPPTAGEPTRAPLHIPLVAGLVGRDGADLSVHPDELPEATPGEHLLELRHADATFTYSGLTERPIPSLLRGFSAPVRLDYPYADEQLAFLFAHDGDDFNRWEAGQRLATRILLQWVEGGPATLPALFRDAFQRTLTDRAADPALVAEALTLPTESYLAEQMAVVDVDGIRRARQALRLALASTLETELAAEYERCTLEGPWRGDAAAVAHRRLRNVVLDYLAASGDDAACERCLAQYDDADNMTDALPALALLAEFEAPAAGERLRDFYRRWRGEPLVVDKWFRIQATSRHPATLARVRKLTTHESFDIHNPNRLRALIGAFCQGNQAGFHDPSGEGYTLLSEHVIKLDHSNPQIAARLLTPLTRWRRYDEQRAGMMRAELERIAGRPQLSSDVHEVVARSLNAAAKTG